MEQVLGSRLEHRAASVGSYAVHLRSFQTVRDFITSSPIAILIDIPFALLFMGVIAWTAWPVLIPLIIGLLIVLGYAWTVKGKLEELSETIYRAGALAHEE